MPMNKKLKSTFSMFSKLFQNSCDFINEYTFIFYRVMEDKFYSVSIDNIAGMSHQ